MNEAKVKLIQWIEQHEAEMITFLQNVVAVPSDNPPGDCEAIAQHVNTQLEQLGLNPSYYEVDQETTKSVGMIRVANVVAEIDFGNTGPHIVLNAHGDVVPPGLGWSVDPYGGQIVDGKLYGRGAAVSKSDIASYTYAAMALRECHTNLVGKLVLAFTFDEETGGEIGPKWLLDQGILKPDAAFCAGFTHSAVVAHNGCLHLEVIVTGKSAHAAIPHTGVDAIAAMVELLQAIYQYREKLDGIQSRIDGITSPTLNVGLISGGINTNVVPDRCVVRLDRRIIPEEDVIDVEAKLRSFIEEAASDIPGIQLEINRTLLAESFGPVAEDTAIVRHLKQNWSEVMNGTLPINGVPLYADARHFDKAGIPTVMFGAGPRTLEEANGHRADEHVKLDDLLCATKIVALTLYDLLNENAT